jgi:hypothetical protein
MFFKTSTPNKATFREEWDRTGTAKVTAFLSPQATIDLRTVADASYGLLQQHVSDDPPTLNEHLADHFKRWDGLWVKELQGFLDRFAPDMRLLLADVVSKAESRFRSLFDKNWRLQPNFTFIRRHRSTRHYLPWHIDADAGSIINATDYSINTWLPLDPVGDVAPSLELIPGSNKTMRELPTLAAPNTTRSDEWVKANIGEQSWIPHAEPGDAILFDHWTLHRTQRLAQENVLRTGCEFRFARI